jgi:hypothetical protein
MATMIGTEEYVPLYQLHVQQEYLCPALAGPALRLQEWYATNFSTLVGLCNHRYMCRGFELCEHILPGYGPIVGALYDESDFDYAVRAYWQSELCYGPGNTFVTPIVQQYEDDFGRAIRYSGHYTQCSVLTMKHCIHSKESMMLPVPRRGQNFKAYAERAREMEIGVHVPQLPLNCFYRI